MAFVRTRVILLALLIKSLRVLLAANSKISEVRGWERKRPKKILVVGLRRMSLGRVSWAELELAGGG